MTHPIHDPHHDDHHDHHHGHHPGHNHTHGNGHDHGYGPYSRWGSLRHTVSGLLGTHSHDVVDQVDDALEADARGRRALWTSLGVLALTAAVQGSVVVWSGSVALLGDTLHNLADALTAIPLLVAFTLARRPANDRFTYGYGRAEDLAGLFVVAMITCRASRRGTRRSDGSCSLSPSTRWARSHWPGSSGPSATRSWPVTGSPSVGRSARPLWSPTACTRAPMASPRSPF